MEENKRKKQPRSRKALEYKVYWLERKLSFLHANKKRDINASKIERLPASPIKELMHLNNEFQRANEQADALKNLTEELNQDALRINEQSTGINELNLEKIAATERLNRQSSRLQERSRKINNEALRTTALGREINKEAKDSIKIAQSRIDEASYLSNLTRAQHEATDNLNARTRSSLEETERVTAVTTQLNDELNQTQAESHQINEQARQLQNELSQVKKELARLSADSNTTIETAEFRIHQLDEVEQSCNETIEQAGRVIDDNRAQIERGEELFQQSTELKNQTEENIQSFAELQAKNEATLADERKKNEQQRQQIEKDTIDFEQTTKASINEFAESQKKEVSEELKEATVQSRNHAKQLTQMAKNHQQKLAEDFEDVVKESREKVAANCEESAQQLTKNLELTENLTETLVKDTQDQFDTQIKENTLLTNEIVDKFQNESKFKLDEFENTSTTAIADFISRSTKSLDKAEISSNILSQRMVNNLDQSQEFLEETSGLNQQARKNIEESRQLNETSLDLHERTGSSLNEVDATISEITTITEQLNQGTRELQTQSQALNGESRKLQEASREINERSLGIQQESVTTQELSQQINDHSLTLHEETRLINSEFGRMNKDNGEILTRLVTLQGQLTEQYANNHEQFESAVRTTQEGEVLNQDSRDLNSESRHLNERTLDVLRDAKKAIAETDQLNKTSLMLSQQIRDAQTELAELKDGIELSNRESREATVLARQSITDSIQVQEQLINSANEVDSVKHEAIEELENLKLLKKEALETTVQSQEACEELRQCINDSRQINDEFMRGLEAAQNAHKETEDNAKSILVESQTLQTEVRDILSLRGPIQDYQENIDRCQTRLDQYADSLANCQRSTDSHGELFNEYQTRIEKYQADIHGYRESIDQFETRARRLESYFTDYDLRLKDLENVENNNQEARVADQIAKMRNMGLEIRRELKTKQTKMDDGITDIRHSLDTALETVGEDLMAHLDAELHRVAESTTEKISTHNHSIKLMENELNNLNHSVTSEVENLREAQRETQEQNREMQQQNRSDRREQSDKLSVLDNNLDDVRHRLDNYQQLLQDQIDDDQTGELGERLTSLELNIKNQQRVLERFESNQVDLSTQLNDQTKVDQLTAMVNKFGRSMEEAVATNKSLKSAISESGSANNQLLKNNKQLHASLQDQEALMKGYETRIAKLEQREKEYESTISSLKSNESDSAQTLQQMRMAMKDSTRAMRDTQKTLEKFRQDEKVSKKSWLESSKQAALTSVFAIFLTGLAMFGYERVDASINPVTAALAQTQEDSFPFQITTEGDAGHKNEDRSLLPLKRANKSIAQLGEFAWPVNFGIVDPNSIRYQPHRRGISISAELGDPVVAINDGTVIYSANEIRGYGNVIVIQHDENLVSVYANNQFNYVKPGDTVRRGQLIGDIGQLFNEDEAGLYFEIRYMGSPEDPFNYLSQSLQSGYLDQNPEFGSKG